MDNFEKSVLFALISQTKGLGSTVAVYPFESTLKRIISNPVDAKLAVYGLQKKNYIILTEKEGHDQLRDKPAKYPVYMVTDEGFQAALEIRKAEQDIIEKIESGSLDDIDLPDFLHDDDFNQ